MSLPIFVIDHSINYGIHLLCQLRGIGWQFLCGRSSSPFFCFFSILFARILIHISSSFSFFQPNFLLHFFQIAVFDCLIIREAKKYIFENQRCYQKTHIKTLQGVNNINACISHNMKQGIINRAKFKSTETGLSQLIQLYLVEWQGHTPKGLWCYNRVHTHSKIVKTWAICV